MSTWRWGVDGENARSVACPLCGAAVGEMCVTSSGRTSSSFHGDRFAANETVSDPLCRSTAAVPNRSTQDRTSKPVPEPEPPPFSKPLVAVSQRQDPPIRKTSSSLPPTPQLVAAGAISTANSAVERAFLASSKDGCRCPSFAISRRCPMRGRQGVEPPCRRNS